MAGHMCRSLLAVSLLAGCTTFEKVEPISKLDAPPTLPQPRTTYMNLGREFLRLNDAEQAKRAFVRSLRVEGVTAAALTGAGLAAERQGLLHEALRFFERAKFRAPESVLAHNNLGAILYRMGDYHEAKQAFQAAFALSSGTNAVATQNLALSEMAIQRARDAFVPQAENPVPVRREGSGEYRLLETTENKSES